MHFEVQTGLFLFKTGPRSEDLKVSSMSIQVGSLRVSEHAITGPLGLGLSVSVSRGEPHGVGMRAVNLWHADLRN